MALESIDILTESQSNFDQKPVSSAVYLDFSSVRAATVTLCSFTFSEFRSLIFTQREPQQAVFWN